MDRGALSITRSQTTASCSSRRNREPYPHAPAQGVSGLTHSDTAAAHPARTGLRHAGSRWRTTCAAQRHPCRPPAPRGRDRHAGGREKAAVHARAEAFAGQFGACRAGGAGCAVKRCVAVRSETASGVFRRIYLAWPADCPPHGRRAPSLRTMCSSHAETGNDAACRHR